jgi:hypothetical protein
MKQQKQQSFIGKLNQEYYEKVATVKTPNEAYLDMVQKWIYASEYVQSLPSWQPLDSFDVKHAIRKIYFRHDT